MIRLGSVALLSALVAVIFCQEYCTDEVKKACKQEIGASACIKTECSNQTSAGDEEFKKIMIDGHNKIRSEEIFGVYGADMQAMQWDDELEDTAMRWLQNLCTTDTMNHDDNECRRTPSYESVGQNLWESTNLSKNASDAGQGAIDAWYSEKNLTKKDEILPYQMNEQAGHYTQMIWAKSNALGCAYLTNPNGASGEHTFVGCNYAKQGNIIGENAFVEGDSVGSKCKEGTSSSGLCKSEGSKQEGSESSTNGDGIGEGTESTQNNEGGEKGTEPTENGDGNGKGMESTQNDEGGGKGTEPTENGDGNGKGMEPTQKDDGDGKKTESPQDVDGN